MQFSCDLSIGDQVQISIIYLILEKMAKVNSINRKPVKGEIRLYFGVSFEYTGKCWSLCTIPVIKTEGLNKGYLIHA
jgi:hypothetical protein